MQTIKNFFNDETGLELSEYAVATALIIGLVVAAFTGLAGAITERIGDVTGTIAAIPD